MDADAVDQTTCSSEERFRRFSDRDAALVRWRFGQGYVARLAERRYRCMFHGGSRILDVGCGVGEAALRAGGADYVGIDLSETQVREGRNRPGRQLTVAAGHPPGRRLGTGSGDRPSCLRPHDAAPCHRHVSASPLAVADRPPDDAAAGVAASLGGPPDAPSAAEPHVLAAPEALTRRTGVSAGNGIPTSVREAGGSGPLRRACPPPPCRSSREDGGAARTTIPGRRTAAGRPPTWP